MRFLPLAILLLAGCATAPILAAPPAATAYPQADGGYAWVRFDARGPRGHGAAGLAERAGDGIAARPLTIDDPVRIASVSKLVVALGVLRLVETGRLDLDRDVSEYLGWRLRNPAFPDAPITLRLLLSHRSSLTDEAGYIVPLGERLEVAVARPGSFDGTRPPGAYFRYSNLNFPVVASVIERVEGERFDRAMARLVLAPLGLRACFGWASCTPARRAAGVTLHHADGRVRKDGRAERLGDCPVVIAEGAGCDLSGYRPGDNGALFSPQGGLRISARDLARVGAMLLAGGRDAWGGRFLRAGSVDALLAPPWRFDGGNGAIEGGFYCAYGLASQTLAQPAAGCRDDLAGGGRVVAGHAGEAYGLLSGLWIDRAAGTGIAYFAIDVPLAFPRGRTAYGAVEEWLAAQLDP